MIEACRGDRRARFGVYGGGVGHGMKGANGLYVWGSASTLQYALGRLGGIRCGTRAVERSDGPWGIRERLFGFAATFDWSGVVRLPIDPIGTCRG
eukprot:7388025-Prymnesium_polylepis.1